MVVLDVVVIMLLVVLLVSVPLVVAVVVALVATVLMVVELLDTASAEVSLVIIFGMMERDIEVDILKETHV